LLKRIQRHNLGMNSLTTSEVRSLLKEIRAIGKMNLAGSLPDCAILARRFRPDHQETGFYRQRR